MDTAIITTLKIKINRRRSVLSASTPAGSERKIPGNMNDACTSPNIIAELSSEVISHEQPIPFIHPPTIVMKRAP